MSAHSSTVESVIAKHKHARLLQVISLLEDDSPSRQAEALITLDELLPSVHPVDEPSEEANVLYDTVCENGVDSRVGHLLLSPSNQILCLALAVYEKLPWGICYISTGPPGVWSSVPKALLRRLMSPDCQVFSTVLRALVLLLNTEWPGRWRDIPLIDVLKSNALDKILKLSSSWNPKVQIAVAKFLGILGFIEKSVDGRRSLIDAGVAQAFLTLLTSPYEDVQNETPDALLSFTRDPESCNALLTSSILPALIEFQPQAIYSRGLQVLFAIVNIMEYAHESTPFVVLLPPGIVPLIVDSLHTNHCLRTKAESVVKSIGGRCGHVPGSDIVLTSFVEPVILLLSSSDDRMQVGAARMVCLIARHENPLLANAFLTAGVVQALVQLLSSQAKFVMQAASSAILCLLSAKTDGRAAAAFRNAGVNEIFAGCIDVSPAWLPQAVINAMRSPLYAIGNDGGLMELFWNTALPSE